MGLTVTIFTGWNSRFHLWHYCGIRNLCTILLETYVVYSELIYFLKVQKLLKTLISIDFAVSFFSRSIIFSTLSLCKAKPQMQPRGLHYDPEEEQRHSIEWNLFLYMQHLLNPLIIAGYSAGLKHFASNVWKKIGIPSSLSTPLLEELSFQV